MVTKSSMNKGEGKKKVNKNITNIYEKEIDGEISQQLRKEKK